MPGTAQGANSGDAQVGTRSERFSVAGKVGVHGGDGEGDGEDVAARDLAQDVGIARDEIRFGDDAETIAGGGREDFEHAARDTETAFGGLIRVSRGADGDGFARIEAVKLGAKLHGVELFWQRCGARSRAGRRSSMNSCV